MTTQPEAQRKVRRTLTLVRGPDGKPKFDNIFNVPRDFLDMMTSEEVEDLKQQRIEAAAVKQVGE